METAKDNKKVIIKVIKILLIIVIWPLYLIFLVHKNEKTTKSAKKVLYIILALVSLVWMVIWAALFQGNKKPDDVPVIENTAAPVTTVTEAETEPVTTVPVTTPTPETEPAEKTDPEEETEPEETKPVKKPTNFSIPNGKLLSVIEGGLNGDVLVIKTKIEYQFTNKATINQNFENIEKIIKSDTFKKYYRDDIKSIDYWAVADMASGEESKAISFTVSENTINNLLDNDYFTFDSTNYEEHVQDLWILPSLSK